MSEPARPLLWARLSVRHTKKTYITACIVPIIATVLIVVLSLFNLSDNGGNDFYLRHDIRTQLDDARTSARRLFPFTLNESGETPFRTEPGETIVLMLRNTERGSKSDARAQSVDVEMRGTNLLTREGLAFLKKAEDGFMASDRFSQFCLIDTEIPADCDGPPRACAMPNSILNHPKLYGDWNGTTLCGRKNGSELVSQSDFTEFLTSLTENNTVNPRYSIFMGTDFNTNSSETQIIRTFVETGFPLEESVSSDFDSWALAAAKNLTSTSTEQFHIYAVGGFSFSDVNSVIMRDLSLAGISIILVFIVVWIHTSSLLLAISGLLQIILAFPLTYFLYRAIFQVKYFAALQIMTIFLILGIGADDIFVFTDAWKQSAVVLGITTSLEARMSWTYRRAVKAMAVTTLTTAAAFFVTASSPIMPISTLGIWAGFLILLQFVLVITMFPSAVIVWQRFWRIRKWRNCLRPDPSEQDQGDENGVNGTTIPTPEPAYRANGDTFDETEVPSEFVVANDLGRVSMGSGPIGRSSVISGDIPHVDDSSGFIARYGSGQESRHSVTEEKRRFCGLLPPARKKKENEYRALERFFNGPWSRWMNFVKFPLIVLGAALIGVSIFLATRLRPPVEQENFLPDDDPAVVASNLLDTAFPVRDSNLNVNVNIMWGVKTIDRSGTSRYQPDNIGRAVFDETFNLQTAAAQQRILDACVYFEEQRKDLLDNQATIENSECWIRDFREWNDGKFDNYTDGAALVRKLREFSNHTDERGTPYMHYLTDQHFAFSEGMTEVKFTEIRFVSRIRSATSYVQMLPEYDLWIEALEEFKSNTTLQSVNKPIPVGGDSWKWMVTQKALVDNMFLGIGVVFAVAMVALTLSTGNLIVSFLALLSIAGIVTNLLGLLNLLGWELGVTESIGVVIAIGFSFDFVAHVANAYTETEEYDRFERTRAALTDLGISILAGAISTLLAGAMLFFATIVFFFKFGFFVFTTIFLSLIWGLAFFPALLFTVGPVGSTGDLKPLFRGLTRCFRRGERDGAPSV